MKFPHTFKYEICKNNFDILKSLKLQKLVKLFIYLHIYLPFLFKVDIINNGFSVLDKMLELCFEETDTRHNMTNQTVYNKTFIFFHSSENRPLEKKLKLTYYIHNERINFKITILVLTSIMLSPV